LNQTQTTILEKDVGVINTTKMSSNDIFYEQT